MLNLTLVPFILLAIIPVMWEFKYSDFPAWIYFSVAVFLGFVRLITYVIGKAKYTEKIITVIKGAWIISLLYSICVAFLLSNNVFINNLLKILLKVNGNVITVKFLLSLPSVGWSLFVFMTCSLTLSLVKNEKWSSFIREEKWIENIKTYFSAKKLRSAELVVIICLITVFICFYDMEYDYRMFFVCIPMIVISIVVGSCLNNSNHKFLAIFVLFIVAAGNWILVSYESYYSGVESRLKKEAVVSYNSTVNILNSSIPDDRKIKEIKNVHYLSDAEILITKETEGVTQDYYVKKSSPQRAEEYLLSTFSDKFAIITYDRDVFKYNFSYYNRPILDIGLARAISFSSFPNYVKDFKKNEFTIGDNRFLEKKNYKRSTNFWFAFWLLYMFTLLVMYYKQTRDEVIKKLQEFDLMYHKMFDDFDKKSVVDTKQQLQRMSLSWNSIIENVLADSRHGLINKLSKINLTELEQELYNKLFKDFEETILTNLRDLPKVLDYHLSDETIEDIIISCKEGIPGNYYDPEKSELIFSEQVDIGELDKTKKCNVNKNRVASIVHNLLTNAGNAVQRKGTELLDQGDIDYQGMITMFYSLKTADNVEYLSIRVKDNAGGFSQDILNKVYKEAVYSSEEENGKKRLGRGTMYVHYFAELMKAKIVVSNEKFDEETDGANVEVRFPIIE